MKINDELTIYPIGCQTCSTRIGYIIIQQNYGNDYTDGETAYYCSTGCAYDGKFKKDIEPFFERGEFYIVAQK